MNEICPHELERALNSWITEGLGLNLEDDAAGIIIDGKVAARNSQRPWVSIVFNFLDDNTVLDNLDRFERFLTQIRSPDVRRKKGALGTPSPPQEIRYLHDTRNGIQRQSSNRAASVGVHSRNSVFMSRVNSSSDSTVCCRGLCRALPFG